MLPRFSHEFSSEVPKAMPARRPPPRATSCIAFFYEAPRLYFTLPAFIAVSLYRCVAASLCRSIAVSLCRSVAVSPYRTIAVSLVCFPGLVVLQRNLKNFLGCRVVVSLCCCLAASLYRCVAVSLCRSIVVSLCRCVAVSLYRTIAVSLVCFPGLVVLLRNLTNFLGCFPTLTRFPFSR